MGVGTVGKKKKSGKHLKKGKAHSKEIISDLGEELNFAGVDNVSFSDDPPNPIPEVTGSTGINAATSDSYTPIWCKAPANLSSSEIDLWNAFVEKLPDSCSNWSKTQAMIQFEVFKGWSNNYLSPGRNHSPNTPVEVRISVMLAPILKDRVIPRTLQLLCRTSLIMTQVTQVTVRMLHQSPKLARVFQMDRQRIS